MGRCVYEASAGARAVFDCADEVLGMSLSKLCFEGPEEELRRTEIQQPAILTTSIALLRALEESGPVRAAYVGGHSLGEYSALVAAGALDFRDAVAAVRMRGRFMQEAVAEGAGAMAAVLGSTSEVVTEACEQASAAAGGVVSPANFNSPQQTVIAGDAAAVEAACELAKQLGAKRCVPLAVSAPFHCALMAPAARRLRKELERLVFGVPDPPVVANVDAEPNSDAGRIADLLEQQVTAPVQFARMVQRLNELGVTKYLEIGPGRVLSGLLARALRRSRRANLAASSDLSDAREFIAGV